MKMNFNRRHVWLPVILILGSLYGYMSYMVLKTEDISDTTFHEPKLQSVYNHSVPRTSNAKKSVASNSTEIDGDERLQIGHYVAGFNLSLIGKEFNFDSSDSALVKAVLRDRTFKRKPVEFIDAKTPFFDLVAPVTGCSSNHYGEFKHHIEEFRKQFPGIKWFFYDLGLNDADMRSERCLI